MARQSLAGWVIALALLAGITPLAASAQAPPVLTLRQAIDEALRENPQGAVARAGVAATEAGVNESRTALLPRFHFVENISRGNDPVYVFGARLRQQRFTQDDFAPNSLNRPTPVGNFATQLSGRWMLFNWFDTEDQIRAAKSLAASAESTSSAANQAIILRVVQAYQAVLYAERRIAVARHEETTARALLADAKNKVRAGLVVDSDMLAAQVNLSERQQARIAAEGDADVSWAELETAMGSEMSSRCQPLQPIQARSFAATSLAEDVANALKARPDLKALRQQTSAQASLVRSAKDSFAPTVSAYGNWEMDKPTFAGSGGNNWVAGVELDFDILPFAKHARLAAEQAAQQKAKAREREQQDQIRLAVNRAWSGQRTAERIVTTAQASMAQSTEGLRILTNRYNAGLATFTDLLRAQDADERSRSDYWRAVYGNTLAYASLLYSTGGLTPNAAEQLQ